VSIAFIATSPPRQCGIATFTRDLADAIAGADPRTRLAWAAINEADSVHPYGPAVRWRIRQGDPASYIRAAHALNEADIDVVALQHEFGLYGIWGEVFDDHLAGFLDAVRKPVVATLHTVLPDPSPSVRAALRRIGERSAAVVVMAETARTLLVRRYGLDGAKVRVVPHGVPPIEPRGRTRMKEQLGLQGRTLLSTFGLVDPRKGLEYAIEAMAAVAARHPEALYVIAGKTHPELVRRAGEAYRSELYALVRRLGLTDHVAFVDEYLSQDAIIEFLLASDVYVTPYLDPNQITSGTLSYALGAGKAIVSTPYQHAMEALAAERGILVPFRSAESIAQASLLLLDEPPLKARLERNAYAYGREAAWPVVGRRMLAIYRAAVEGAVRPPAAVFAESPEEDEAVAAHVPTAEAMPALEPAATAGDD
jgi:glycosyltransferase involved in cell wall biosynthesis